MDGVHFDHVIQLAKFDQKLRHKTLEGLEIIETGIKSQIAYIAGVESCFAHLEEASMEDGTPEEKWEKWKDRYDSLCKRAAEEDYYKHHIQKYSGELPIWIATEVLDFGGMCFLFEMLKKKTQSKISQNLNVKQGTMLSKWLLSLNHTRNRCAHFNRLWNRPLKRTIKAPRHGYVDDTLHHLHDVKETDKIYISLAVIAYLTRQIDPNTRWPIHLRELMKKFPQVPYLSAENDMGFPADWSQYALWKP